MATRFFTADLHLNSHVLVDRHVRPFASIDEMNDALIGAINDRGGEDDLLIHVGDIIQYGNDREWPGEKVKPSEFIRRMNPTFVNVKGNHDANNEVMSACNDMRTYLGNRYSVSVGHYPSNNPKARGTFRKGDVHLCGHVHGAWRHFVDFDNKVLNVNVGVDTWDYRPVSEDELISYIDQVMATNGRMSKK